MNKQLGFTPLHQAAFTNDIQLAKKLLDSGEKITSKNIFGDTAIHWASWLGNLRILDFFAVIGGYASLFEKIIKEKRLLWER